MSLPTDSTISKDLTWVKTHLLLLAIVVLLTFGGIFGVLQVIASHDHDRAVELQTIAQQIGQQNQLLQQQTKAQIDSLTQQNVALQQEIGTLATAIAARDSQLQKTQASVPNLSPDQLSTEWMTRIKNAGQIKPAQSGYAVDQAAAVATVQALESVPVLEQDKYDLQQSNTALSQQLTNESSKFDLEVKAHVSDQTACQADLKAVNAQLKSVKAQARKRNIIIAVVSTAVGIVIKAALL